MHTYHDACARTPIMSVVILEPRCVRCTDTVLWAQRRERTGPSGKGMMSTQGCEGRMVDFTKGSKRVREVGGMREGGREKG